MVGVIRRKLLVDDLHRVAQPVLNFLCGNFSEGANAVLPNDVGGPDTVPIG